MSKTDVAVEDFLFVVIFRLHHLVTDSQNASTKFYLCWRSSVKRFL